MTIQGHISREDTPGTAIDPLLRATREKRLVVFAGAGISMDPPTSLPSWAALSGEVVNSIAERASTVISDSSALATTILDREKRRKFPPDYIAEKIVHTIGGAYFEVLRCVDSDRPNENHLALAELAAAGKLRAIVTTNFDRTIEAAFTARGIPLEVRADPPSVQTLLLNWEKFERGGSPCQLLKLHGTADRPGTIIDTLAQRARGTPVEYLECIRRLLMFGYWLFLGYSGADLETQRDYLGLAAGHMIGCGLTWLFQVGTRPLDGVVRLKDAWAEKADLKEGDLREVLTGLLEGAQPVGPSKELAKVVDVAAAARNWSQQLSERRCALIIAELLSFSEDKADARRVLEQLAETYPQHKWKIAQAWKGNTLVLKADDGTGKLPSYAKGFGDPASPLVVALAPDAQIDVPDLRNYSDALYGLADVLDQLGERDAARRIAMRSILAGLYVPGRTAVVRGLGILADIRREDDTPIALEEADRMYIAAIEAARTDILTASNLMVNRAQVLLRLGKKKEAFGLLIEARQHFRELGDERGRVVAEHLIAVLCSTLADYGDATRFWTDVLEVAKRLGDDRLLYEAALGLGRLYRAIGECALAQDRFGDALNAAESLKDAEREKEIRSVMLTPSKA